MQINRLFEIVYILLDKKSITAKELAEHFEVSTRTIYRDIDTLSSAGIPIYANQGKGGGITILDNFVLNKSVLSENEQNELLIALQSLKATKYLDVDLTLSKLSSLFKKDNYNWIEVDFSNWGSSEEEKSKFNTLKKAIINNNFITFQYYSSYGEKSNRKIEPMKLIFKTKAWYLHGFCLEKEDYRTFKISRMFNLEISEEKFNTRPLEGQLNKPEENEIKNLINVKLKFSSNAAYRLYGEFDENIIIKNEDGSFEVTTSLPQGEWIYDYILSFGSMVEVLEPEQVRQVVIKRLHNMIKKYK